MFWKSLLYATLIITLGLGLGVWVGYQFGGVGVMVYFMWLGGVVSLTGFLYSILEVRGKTF